MLFLFFLFPFCSGDFHYPVFQITDPLYCTSDLLLIPSRVFFLSVIVFFSSNWFSFAFSLLRFSLCSSILLNSVSIFMTITLNYSSLFSSISHLSCSLIWNIFLCSFCLILCCFYVLNRSDTSPTLKGVALCRRCPVGL